MVPTKTEADWVVACQQGDTAAADVLVDLHWERVYSFCYRLTLNQADAEDFAQETFLRAFQRLASYKPTGQFRSWLLRISTNLFLDEKKSARCRLASSSEVAPLAREHENPAEVAGRNEFAGAVWEQVQALSKEQQVVVTLRALEKLDYPEIAEAVGIKESTARWHMYEARRLLRQRLGKRFEMEEGGAER